MSAFVSEKIETVVNSLTGEILSETVEFVESGKVPDEPAYMKVYLEDLGHFKQLTAGEIKVLIYVAAQANYDGVVVLPMITRKRIAESSGAKLQTVTNAIYKFLNAGIIKRIESVEFVLNPDYFAKGKWRDIREQRKAFQSITTYKPDGTKKTETRIVDDLVVSVNDSTTANDGSMTRLKVLS